MKKFTLVIFMALIVAGAHAQWTPVSSGTTVNLNDIDFLDANNGAIVGDSGTLLITNNGGLYWTSLGFGSPSVKVTNVKMISPDTIIVSSIDFNNIPQLTYTQTGGSFWIPLFQDSTCFRGADVESGPDYKWVLTASSILSTDDHGQYWDTLMQYTCGTNNIDQIKRTDSVYNAGGLISGFSTYSASMVRSENGGNTFHELDPFSFPNADAFTAMDFPWADTGYVFMNKFNGFMPGTRNSLVRFYDFVLTEIFPGDSAFTFSYDILDTTIPSWINDAKIMQSGLGFACGEDGNIYQTSNSGSSWTVSYNNGVPVNKIAFPDTENGWAIGDNGTIMKYSSPTSVSDINRPSLYVYPNPASAYLIVRGAEDEEYSLSDINGKTVQTGKITDGRIDLKNISSGSYILSVEKKSEVLRSRIVVK
jgi:photosystem II stability/assembly factor-like uncharacterized protein